MSYEHLDEFPRYKGYIKNTQLKRFSEGLYLSLTRFVDDNELEDWGRPSVYYMAEKGIIRGVGDNMFNGLGNAKIEEAIIVTLRCIEMFNAKKL